MSSKLSLDINKLITHLNLNYSMHLLSLWSKTQVFIWRYFKQLHCHLYTLWCAPCVTKLRTRLIQKITRRCKNTLMRLWPLIMNYQLTFSSVTRWPSGMIQCLCQVYNTHMHWSTLSLRYEVFWMLGSLGKSPNFS